MGHRLTFQRLAVPKILAKSKRHPGVKRIYEMVQATFPTAGLARGPKGQWVLTPPPPRP